jgi:hypothetical protein
MNVDFEHAWVGGNFDDVETGIERRGIAFENNRDIEQLGSVFDSLNNAEIILQGPNRRHEDVEPALTRFDTDGSANNPRRGLTRGRRAGQIRRQLLEREPLMAQPLAQPTTFAASG